MTFAFCLVTNATIVAIARQTTLSMLFCRYLHGFLFPKTMDPFLVDLPATRYK